MVIVSVSIIGVLRVFSWSEPEYDMPSNYLTPLNTSEDGQVKYGELAVVILRDADNLNYYLNPSTDSNLNQLHINNIQAVDNICLDSGVCLSQIEEYINNQLLVYGAHTLGDCTSAGGTLIDDPDSSMQFCKFIGAACPSSWTQYKNYSTTTQHTCQLQWRTCPYSAGSLVSCSPSCTTSSHSWGNVSLETCGYAGLCSNSGSPLCGASLNQCYTYVYCCSRANCTCYATVNQIGCY